MTGFADQPISRRRALQFAALGACGVTAGSAVFAQSAMKARVAWQSSAQTATYLYAHSSGLLRRQGLDVEHLKFSAGPPIFAALRSGSVDIAFMAETPAAVLLSQKIPAQAITVSADYGGAMGLVAVDGSGITKAADLRGKKIAVVRGSAAHFALGSILKDAGMSLNDVQLLNLDVTALIPAFQNRNVDAALYWEPWMSRLEQSGGKLILTNWQAHQPSATMWFARTEWLQGNGSAAVAFLRGLDAAVAELRTHPAQVAERIAPELGLESADLSRILTSETKFPTLSESLDPHYVYSIAPQAIAAKTGLAGVIEKVGIFMKDAGVIDRLPDVTTGITAEYALKATKA